MILSWIIFGILGLISSILKETNGYNENYMAVIVIFILSFAICAEVIFVFKRENQRITLMVCAGYFIRLILLFWDVYAQNVFLLPESGGDSVGFQRIALLKMTNNTSSTYGGTYTDILGLLYRIFGPSRLLGQYLNVLFWITTVFVLYLILNKLDVDEKNLRFGIFIVCFAPHFTITNVELLREVIITLIISFSLYYFIKWWLEEYRLSFLVLAIVFCLFGSTFHSGAIAPAIGYVIVALLYDRSNNHFRFNVYTVVGLIVVLFIFSYINNRYGNLFFNRFQGVDIEQRLENISVGSGGSGYKAGINIGNPILSVLVNTPIKTLYFWLAPMPWDWRGLSDFSAFVLSSVLYISCYFDIIRCFYHHRIDNDNLQLLIAFLLIILSASVVFSWGVSNAGTAIRHRDKFITIYIVMWVIARQAIDNSCAQYEDKNTQSFNE